jgi:hypothetical protein
MGKAAKATPGSINIAEHGIMFQFNAMFDEPTKKAMMDLGIQKFLDHQISVRATDLDTIMFYASCLHPKANDS